MSDCCYFWF